MSLNANRTSQEPNYSPCTCPLKRLNTSVLLWWFVVSQHMNAMDEAYMLRRPSSLFWCDNVTALSCLEISSVTLTPMSSPESNISGGLLTPPPVKPPLLTAKPSEGCSIPRPRVKLLSCLSHILPAFVFLLLLL